MLCLARVAAAAAGGLCRCTCAEDCTDCQGHLTWWRHDALLRCACRHGEQSVLVGCCRCLCLPALLEGTCHCTLMTPTPAGPLHSSVLWAALWGLDWLFGGPLLWRPVEDCATMVCLRDWATAVGPLQHCTQPKRSSALGRRPPGSGDSTWLAPECIAQLVHRVLILAATGTAGWVFCFEVSFQGSSCMPLSCVLSVFCILLALKHSACEAPLIACLLRLCTSCPAQHKHSAGVLPLNSRWFCVPDHVCRMHLCSCSLTGMLRTMVAVRWLRVLGCC